MMPKVQLNNWLHYNQIKNAAFKITLGSTEIIFQYVELFEKFTKKINLFTFTFSP